MERDEDEERTNIKKIAREMKITFMQAKEA
jgi:WD40 repeat protein